MLFLRFDQVSNDVGLSHVQEKVISQNKWSCEFNKSSIADPQVFYFVSMTFKVEEDLELPASVFLFLILVFSRDNKVVDDLLL